MPKNHHEIDVGVRPYIGCSIPSSARSLHLQSDIFFKRPVRDGATSLFSSVRRSEKIPLSWSGSFVREYLIIDNGRAEANEFANRCLQRTKRERPKLVPHRLPP